MGMTIVEKILARAAGLPQVRPGDTVVVDVDRALLIDSYAINHLKDREILQVPKPGILLAFCDHEVPAPSIKAAKGHRDLRRFVEKFNLPHFHDVGREQGISHVVVAERAYALPGSVLVCDDSHTCSSGALNCAARSITTIDLIEVVTTGKTWFKVSETIRYDFEGRLSPGVSMKDVFLHISNVFGQHANRNVEFGGPGLSELNMNARRTMATMGAELSADFVIFDPDDILIKHIKERTDAPFEPVRADLDAAYRERRSIDLGTIQPMVALPDAMINNSVFLDQVEGTEIQQAFIGSCANGTLDDLRVAAEVVDGRRVAHGVRFIVTPGSQHIYRQALKAGYIEKLVDAGAVVTNATCGACAGDHLGVLGPGETCITASTRNFKGRMGDPSARIYMGSPATVAASALRGAISHPGQFFTKAHQ